MKAELEGTIPCDGKLSVLTFGRKSGYICSTKPPSSATTGKRTRAELERVISEANKRFELAGRVAKEARTEIAELAERIKALEAEQESSAKVMKDMKAQFKLIRDLLGSSMLYQGTKYMGLGSLKVRSPMQSP